MNADKILQNSFADKDIFFVTPDVKRGIGLDGILPGYHIVCSYYEPLVSILRKQGASVFCLQEHNASTYDNFNNTGKLLEHPYVEKYIKEKTKDIPWIMYFKPSQKIDLLLGQKGFRTIGNNAKIGNAFENKVYFQRLLFKFTPQNCIPARVGKLHTWTYKELVKDYGIPFVVQFGFGWAGKGTYFVDKESEYDKLSQQYQYTDAKVSKKVKGFTVLNNCCIHNGNIMQSPPAIQISNIPELFDNPAVTCGRQWPVRFLDIDHKAIITRLSQVIGKLLIASGFKGFFGIDFLVESSTGKIYISEVNARLTASSSFYTRLELGLHAIPLLAYHVASFLKIELPIQKPQSEELKGSQIVLRSESKTPIINSSTDFAVFKYQDQRLKKERTDYYPENLSPREFIYIKNKHVSMDSHDQEFARIETKEEVLSDPYNLRDEFLEVLKQRL